MPDSTAQPDFRDLSSACGAAQKTPSGTDEDALSPTDDVDTTSLDWISPPFCGDGDGEDDVAEVSASRRCASGPDLFALIVLVRQ